MTRHRPHRAPVLARKARLRAGALLAVCLAASAPREARAQADINPPLPNVMLLVDTSGSMEYKTGVDSFPSCAPASASGSEKSRWIELVETLTGSIQNYRCEKIDRTQATFASSRYGTGGPLNAIPYDYLYPNPYHRPLSGTCAVYPAAIDALNVFNFPATALGYHPYTTVASNCTFPEGTDGIMDAFAQSIRFGLMTFDTATHAGTGYAASGTTPVHGTGIAGTWSYIRTGDTATTGLPAGCIEPQPMEVGARNAGAPVWEGRMVGFGVPDQGSTDFLTKKAQIEKVLLATRPYGATPIAGMLEDAYDFMRLESMNDPANPGQKLGPKDDPYVTGGCRKQFIILLTDGQPNLDLRPRPWEDPAEFCQDAVAGSCPFRKPEVTAAALNSGLQPIRTFVVGFALSSFTVGGVNKTCNDLNDADFTTPGGSCNAPANLNNQPLQACCALNRIAIAGGTGTTRRALFAANRQELTSALSKILTEITPVTSRTQPVISGAAGGAKGFRFFSSVKPVGFQPWVGVLERQRYTCESQVVGGSTRYFAQAKTITESEGDDFAANVNSGLHRNRRFYSVEGGIGAEPIYSGRTIRPYIGNTDNDGIGVYKGVQYSGDDQPSSTFVSGTPADAMSLTGVCTDLADVNLCRDRHMKWLIGLDNGTSFTRCRAKGTNECYLLGDILHSTPRVVPPPSDFLRDESYTAFKAAKAKRPVVLYTSTNDGFLHAFKVTGTVDDMAGSSAAAKVETKTNNELWAFMPPAVLPLIPSQYPFTHQLLLDGVPVVRDVVATVTGTGGSATIALERTRTQAQAGTGDWRTILVQSFGAGRGGYFALDVTDPDQLEDYTSTTSMGPRFLWQLTTDSGGAYQLFGKSGGTPLITTLYFDPAGGSSPKEIPVAVLPGGRGDVVSPASQCPSSPRVWTGIDPDFPPRGKVRCYTGVDNQAARSLTIVRLDTGELIRTFRQAATEIVLSDATAQGKLRAKVTAAPLDSPITGQPVAFPAGVGAIADRVYVGDQDGRIWRANLASTNPANWSMNLFFDAYPATYGADPNFPNVYNDGQPILLPPALSVDANGDVTLNVATGDQDALGASAGMKNFVWSLTEKTNSDRTPAASDANWFLPMTGGERVVGPMQLFNSALYFASYAPPTGSNTACQNGVSRVWGMNYLLGVPGTGSSILVNQGGRGMLPGSSGLTQYLNAQVATGDANATIFGVTVAQEPTCTGTATQSAQDYLGYGSHTTINSVTPGKFQLIMHTGTGGTQVAGGTSRISTLDLAAPASAARVESWAALVE